MHLHRNFVWTLDLSEKELRVIIKCVKGEELSEQEQSLADKLADALVENAARLERVSAGKRRHRRQ